MADNESATAEPSPADSRQRWLKFFGAAIGILASTATIIWLFFNSLYDRNVLCSVDIDACRTSIAQLEASLLTVTARPAAIETIQVTVVHTLIVSATPMPTTWMRTPSPTSDPFETGGHCNGALSNAPCTYVLNNGDRWQQIAQDSPYGDNCRYPELMDINRRSDGTYPRLSGYDSDVGRPITIMPAAPSGTYDARIRDELGEFKILQECNANGFPCVFVVTEDLPLFTYDQISQRVYRNNLFGNFIAQANLASDCSGRGEEIRLGSRLVIPKRPLFTPTPDSS
jgi:hypothetical protein